MTLTFKRNPDGSYDGNTKTFNHDTGKHESIFNVIPYNGKWNLKQEHEERGMFDSLKQAKAAAQEIENMNPPYTTDEDEGLAHASYAPGQTISTYISAERIGGRLYVSDDGKSLISETRYPDGTIEKEERKYGE